MKVYPAFLVLAAQHNNLLDVGNTPAGVFYFFQKIPAGNDGFGVGVIQDIARLVFAQQEHNGHNHRPDAPDGLKAGKHFRRVRQADDNMISFSDTQRF